MKLAKESIAVRLLNQLQVGLSQFLRANGARVEQGTPADDDLFRKQNEKNEENV